MLWGMTLDPEAKARIEAEERYRAEVRGTVQQEQVRANPPGYWGGFVLNMLLTGFGFFLIGEAGAGFLWAGVALVLALLGLFPAVAVVWLMSLMHYRSAYAAKYG